MWEMWEHPLYRDFEAIRVSEAKKILKVTNPAQRAQMVKDLDQWCRQEMDRITVLVNSMRVNTNV